MANWLLVQSWVFQHRPFVGPRAQPRCSRRLSIAYCATPQSAELSAEDTFRGGRHMERRFLFAEGREFGLKIVQR